MAKKPLTREKRQQELAEHLELNPLCTDEELAQYFGVSIPTIRLDRMTLGIPELRQRLRTVAQGVFGKVRSLAESELVGELLDLELGKGGLSVLSILPEMVLARTKVARGHFLFAQANSLAVAVIDADLVLTGSARIRYKRPVYLHERVVAKAVVKAQRGITYLVSVYSKVDAEMVFKGQFVVSALDRRVPREA
ncbi:DeoR faimly transcriptional regulator [Clostridiales bacterium PH28_bin88]|nr:DeoR faimly transcriptional regulator [Clostridiales bacterium PH28_bin88]